METDLPEFEPWLSQGHQTPRFIKLKKGGIDCLLVYGAYTTTSGNRGGTNTVYAYLKSGTGTSTSRNETISATSVFGTLKVKTIPGYVTVYIGGEPGSTTDYNGDATINGLIPGLYSIKFVKSGYQDLLTQTTITAGQTTTYSAVVIPIP